MNRGLTTKIGSDRTQLAVAIECLIQARQEYRNNSREKNISLHITPLLKPTSLAAKKRSQVASEDGADLVGRLGEGAMGGFRRERWLDGAGLKGE